MSQVDVNGLVNGEAKTRLLVRLSLVMELS